jgi:hypothetical protein
MTTIRTYVATSRSGAVRERKTECEYTHAYDNGHEIVSFHQSFNAAKRAARGHGYVVPVELKEARERGTRTAKNDDQVVAKAVKYFSGKLHFGEKLSEIRVAQYLDPFGDGWKEMNQPLLATYGVIKEFRAAGITVLALKNETGDIADFTTEGLLR